MSFSFEFKAASKNAALHHLAKQYAPPSVLNFIEQALEGVKDGQAVHVKAQGHLYQPDTYASSNATIEVVPLDLVKEPS